MPTVLRLSVGTTPREPSRGPRWAHGPSHCPPPPDGPPSSGLARPLCDQLRLLPFGSLHEHFRGEAAGLGASSPLPSQSPSNQANARQRTSSDLSKPFQCPDSYSGFGCPSAPSPRAPGPAASGGRGRNRRFVGETDRGECFRAIQLRPPWGPCFQHPPSDTCLGGAELSDIHTEPQCPQETPFTQMFRKSHRPGLTSPLWAAHASQLCSRGTDEAPSGHRPRGQSTRSSHNASLLATHLGTKPLEHSHEGLAPNPHPEGSPHPLI